MKKKIKQTFLSIKLPEWDSNILNQKGNYKIMETGKDKKKSRLWLSALCPAVICLFVVGLFYYNNHYVVQNTVAIDVNPSLELKINKKNEVIEVVANNDDAQNVLQGMNLKGSDINVAVNALIGSMVQLGYLDDVANSILISVDGTNSDALRLELLNNLNIDSNYSVVSQEISTNYADIAKEYNISEGKVQLIYQVLESNPLHTFEELASLSIHELNLLLGSTDNTVGSASEKAYIGRDNALMIALNHASLTSDDITYYEVEFDYDHVIVYEVSFYYNGIEYEYEIEATTGDILEYEIDGKDHHIYNSSNNTTDQSSSQNTTNSYIGKDEALAIALEHAGLTTSDIHSLEIELDVDYNMTTYEIEFDYQHYEYEYEIDAYTGEIIKSEIDH